MRWACPLSITTVLFICKTVQSMMDIYYLTVSISPNLQRTNSWQTSNCSWGMASQAPMQARSSWTGCRPSWLQRRPRRAKCAASAKLYTLPEGATESLHEVKTPPTASPCNPQHAVCSVPWCHNWGPWAGNATLGTAAAPTSSRQWATLETQHSRWPRIPTPRGTHELTNAWSETKIQFKTQPIDDDSWESKPCPI